MAHTVETLSKLLKKSPDQVITILSAQALMERQQSQIFQLKKDRF